MSGCKSYETTNEALDRVAASLKELIAWAEADSQHAQEHDAPDTARDDRARAKLLTRALGLVEQAYR